MKYSIHIFNILLILFTFAHCKNSTITDSNPDYQDTLIYHVDIPKKIDDTYCLASSIADTVLYVPLETTSNSLLGDIRLIAMNDSFLVVSDKNNIMAFQRDGKFIRQIGRSGGGPGEFGIIFNFVLKKDTLFISSGGKSGIDIYTMDGEYHGFIKQESRMLYFSEIEEVGYAWYDWVYGNVVYFNEKWEITDSISVEPDRSKQREQHASFSTDDTFLNKTDKKLLFYNYLTDTVWDITTKDKKPSIIFNLNERILPENLLLENSSDTDLWKEKTAQYYRVNFMESDSFICILERTWGGTNELPSFITYNKNSNIIKKFEYPIIYDDISGKRSSSIFFFLDNMIVSTIYYDQLLEGYNKADSPDVKDFWEKLLIKVNENDNSILVIYKIK